jgi:hypothetical protein
MILVADDMGWPSCSAAIHHIACWLWRGLLVGYANPRYLEQRGPALSYLLVAAARGLMGSLGPLPRTEAV